VLKMKSNYKRRVPEEKVEDVGRVIKEVFLRFTTAGQKI